MGVAAYNVGHHHPLEGGHPLRVQLVDVVAQPKLPVAVVTPAIHLPVLQDRHGAGLAAGDAHNLPPSKGSRHLPRRRLVGRGPGPDLATVILAP